MGESTNEKRLERLVRKKSVVEQNTAWKRLIWAREKLEYSVKKVADETGIPRSTISDWESGIRTTYWEEWNLLIMFYSSSLKRRFASDGIYYKGIRIETDLRNFIEMGTINDPTIEDLTKALKSNHDIEEKIRRDIEVRRFGDSEARSQLDIFTIIDASDNPLKVASNE
jgi:transcriptional regulator with XRE-family HTH domain